MQLQANVLQIGNYVTLWTCIRKLHGSNLADDTDYSKCSTVFPSPSRQLLGLLRLLGYDHFLPNPFQFIIHQ